MTSEATVALPADRFDESFLIRTIRDFFLALIVVIVLELGFRFLLVLYDYYLEEKRETDLVAERLASSVKSIMLNSGGPIAARTVYPILQNNLADLGFEVAIVPSKMTVSSIEAVFDFSPRGIVPDWSEGAHHEATVQLRAEEFCQQCHIESAIGDVLGHVTVHKTLLSHLERWWHEVQVAGMIGMVNILLHTVVLYLLLKARMAPVLALRDAIGLLAKAGSDLTVRAGVLSRDEFGQLARDVNLFIDRIAQITEDLLRVLINLQDLNNRLNRIRVDMEEQSDVLHGKVDDATKLATKDGAQLGVVTQEWEQTVDALSALLADLSARGELPQDTSDRLQQAVGAWRRVASEARASGVRRKTVTASLVELGQDLGAVSHLISDMAVLEERMTALAQEGQILLKRLLPSAQPTAGDPTSSSAETAGRSIPRPVG